MPTFLSYADAAAAEQCTTYVHSPVLEYAFSRRVHGLIHLWGWGNQDMGNTNFSIHLPRNSFDRHVTSQLVLRAVRSFGIDAQVNERNDICVGPYKMSLS